MIQYRYRKFHVQHCSLVNAALFGLPFCLFTTYDMASTKVYEGGGEEIVKTRGHLRKLKKLKVCLYSFK